MKLARIEHGLMASFATLVGFALGAGGWRLVQPYAALAVAVTLAAEVGLFVFNDIFNLEEDRINAPHRPLVRGEVSLREAQVLGVLSLATSMMLSLPLGLFPTSLVVFAVASGMAYNIWLKRTGLLGNMVVALDTALPFLFGASIPCGFKMPWLVILLTLIAFLATLGREVLKGIVDMEGDRRAGVRTLALVRGSIFAARVSSFLMLTAVAMSLLAVPFVPERSWLAYVTLVALTDSLFAYVAILLLLRDSRDAAIRGRTLTLSAMLLGILAFATAA